ncbi:GDP-L-fucose synthase family protein [Desulfonatronovibrio magnus]|uniref:GDP-L-fucose synthase family protein n=1 Tax=Desulfonatronovibrio magnus TaxID=698827 RepID=UPI0005EBB791|nr:GDP-L-fucose synthase [Desulfonatronovibrio magnus]
MLKNSTILIAGISGLVGSALSRALQTNGYVNIIGTYQHRQPDLPFNTYQVDLRDQLQVAWLFQKVKPEYVFLAAAKVGGIMANNTYRAEFIYDNLCITSNVINSSYLSKVKKLLYLGSTCIYPRDCPQPMKEDHLLTSPLEYTNEPYAIAKIAGLKMCESFNLQYGTNYISVMPTNLYGPGDNFDLEKAHVLPAMMRKVHLAKLMEQDKWQDVLDDLQVETKDKAMEILDRFGVTKNSVEIWGTGKPKREFLWSEDMAEACVFIMKNIDFPDLTRDMKEIRNTHINIGSGVEISIGELARKVKEIVGFTGELVFNKDKPDGTPRKLTDVSKLHSLGWKHKTDLDEGLRKFYAHYAQTDSGNPENT